MNTIANQIPSVWSMSDKDLSDHLAYISQQGLTRVNREHNGMLTSEANMLLHQGDLFTVTMYHLVDALTRAIREVEHHLGWIRASKQDSAYDPEQDLNLVQARVAMLAVWRYADEVRNLNYGR